MARSRSGGFKGVDVINVVKQFHQGVTVGRTQRRVGIILQDIQIKYDDGRGGTNKSDVLLNVVFVRDDKKFSMSLPEAEQIAIMLGEALPIAREEEARLEVVKEQRRKQDAERDQYYPKKQEGFSMGKGKTDRKKKKGKAGKSYHQERKAKRAVQDRETSRSMGAGRKKA